MKSKVTINIDTMILEDAKINHINISRAAEESLRSHLNVIKGDISSAEEPLIRSRLERSEKQLNKLQGEVSGLRSQLVVLEELKTKKREELMQKEKDMIESMKTCIGCKNIILEVAKKHKFNKGYVCNACFLSADSDSIKRWNDG